MVWLNESLRRFQPARQAGGVVNAERPADLAGHFSVAKNIRMDALILEPAQELGRIGLGRMPVPPMVDQGRFRLVGDVTNDVDIGRKVFPGSGVSIVNRI